MNKLGPHIQRLTPDILNWIGMATPPVVVWIDPNQDGVDAIRARSPATFIVGRRYEGGRDWQTNAGPHFWADQCAAMARCDAYYCWNEPFGHDHAGLFAAFDEWQVAFRERLLEHGIEAVAFNFGTGNFTRDGPNIKEAFPKTCAVFHYFGIHEYYWPVMREAVGYYCLRFPFWYRDIGRDDVEFLVTECGMTQMVHEGWPDRGWRDDVSDAPTDEEYLAELDWYNQQLCQYNYMRGAALFNWGGYGWETFEHGDHPIRLRIAELDAPGPPPPEPQEPEEPMTDEIRVVDLEYKERDLAYVESKYGVAFRRAEVAPGQKVYRLVELWEKTGTTSLVTQVLNEDGNPMADVDVAFYWPDAPISNSPNVHDWEGRFVHGPTNKDGDVGPGMGPGAYHGEGEGGPHAVWVRDPDIPSDICEKLGMLAGTFHDHLDQKFQLMIEGEQPQPEPPSPPPEKVLQYKERLEFSHDANMMGIAIDDDYAVENDARGDFRGLGVDIPPIHPKEWTHPITGERMALMEGCCNFNGGKSEARIYTMRVRNLKTSELLTSEEGESFLSLESGIGLTRVIYVYELIEKPSDPEPPPSSDLDAKVEAMLAAIAKANREMAAIDATLAAELEKLANG